jgi:hypothetical protein
MTSQRTTRNWKSQRGEEKDPNWKLASSQSRAIIGSLDTPVDIGVPAEKEVIQ